MTLLCALRPPVVAFGCFVIAAEALLGAGLSNSEASECPNVLLITVDTLRADHLSSYGYHRKTSPAIDRLATQGTRFERVYTVVPQTGPAHFSLFTSRYPQEHGARINGVAVPQDSSWMVLPQILKKFGFRNAAFVSAWPLTSRLTHLDRWFDTYDEDLTRSYQLLNSSRYAEDVTPRAIGWLQANDHRPFFLWVHYFDPHAPYHLREEFADLPPSGGKPIEVDPLGKEMAERIQRYDSEIAYADRHIGELLRAVDEQGLSDSTLVVFTGDHGESLGAHSYVGHGRHLYEDIVRIPLILRYPQEIPARKVIPEAVSLLDVTPTILDFALGSLPHPDRMPASFAGISLKRAIQQGVALTARPNRFVTFSGKKGFMPRWLSWMWVSRNGLPLRMGQIDGFQKTIWTPQQQALAIYDVQQDPLETSPSVPSPDAREYRQQTAPLERWFGTTASRAASAKLTKRDIEVLKSLGYLQ